MKNKLIYAIAASTLLLAATQTSHGQTLSGDTFTDPLTNAADAYWSTTTLTSSAVTYSAAGTTLTGTITGATPPGTSSDADRDLTLPTGALPTINGDFTTSINFSSAVLNAVNNGALLDFYVTFASGDNYILTYGPSGTPTGQNVLNDMNDITLTNSANAGTLSFTRSGNTLSDAFDGVTLSTTDITGEGALTEVDYEVFADVVSGSSTNSAIFSTYSLSAPELAATPEPGTLALAGLGVLGGLLANRRRK